MVFWLALTFFVIAFVGSAAVAGRRGLETYRAFRDLGRGAGAELGRITASTAEIEGHLRAAAASGEQLSASLERLSVSRARLTVLTSALSDARASLDRVGSLYPRK